MKQHLSKSWKALKSSFAEPPDVQRRRLASEFSTMKQRVSESIDRFAFRFKNNIHPLAKVDEPVDQKSPQFMSQFLNKTKLDIQKHLVLKAEYLDLSEIIEAAKRIEHSFSRSHSQPNKQLQEQTEAFATNPAPGFPRGRGKGPGCFIYSYGHIKGSCPGKTTILRILKEVTSLPFMEHTSTISLRFTRPIMQILTGMMMAAGRVTFSSAFMLNFLVFLLFSYLNSQSYYFNWRLSLIGHGFDVPKSALEPSAMRYSDLPCLCRVRHFELKSWHTRMKLKRYLRRRLLYSANGTASFNPSILENILSGDIHPQPGPNSTPNSTSTPTNANISFPSNTN